tara:strand:- start:329 stop:577 length:249 start_codon:yes stop_codon:yes gene_type:complete
MIFLFKLIKTKNMKSHFEMSNYLELKGYDIFPFKTKDGKFKVSLWVFDKFIDYGKFEYNKLEDAIFKTTKDIYNKLVVTDMG